jgi:hypothetical protein
MKEELNRAGQLRHLAHSTRDPSVGCNRHNRTASTSRNFRPDRNSDRKRHCVCIGAMAHSRLRALPCDVLIWRPIKALLLAGWTSWRAILSALHTENELDSHNERVISSKSSICANASICAISREDNLQRFLNRFKQQKNITCSYLFKEFSHLWSSGNRKTATWRYKIKTLIKSWLLDILRLTS